MICIYGVLVAQNPSEFYEKRFDVVKRMIKSHYTVMKSIEFALNSSKENI